MPTQLRISFCLACLGPSMGCHSAKLGGDLSPWHQVVLFASADAIVHGRLEVMASGPDPWTIKIGNTLVYVGGDGKEVPPDTDAKLRQLQGLDVLAGVHAAEFHFGTVLVVMCYHHVLALGASAQLSRIATACDALRSQVDWLTNARALETGRWDGFLSSLRETHRETADILLGRFLQSATAEEIANDITGWFARMVGKRFAEWPNDRVRIGDAVMHVSDVRDVARLVLENTLQLPSDLLAWCRGDDLEESRRIWMLVQISRKR